MLGCWMLGDLRWVNWGIKVGGNEYWYLFNQCLQAYCTHNVNSFLRQSLGEWVLDEKWHPSHLQGDTTEEVWVLVIHSENDLKSVANLPVKVCLRYLDD